MANIFHLDHKLLAGSLLAASTGLALYSSSKLFSQSKNWKKVEETPEYLHERLLFEYGCQDELIGAWPQYLSEEWLNSISKCVELCKRYARVKSKVLDIGCGVGRSSFELSSAFDKVLGIDHRKHFVSSCEVLKDKGILNYTRTTEGELTVNAHASVDPFINRKNVDFLYADPSCLPLNLGEFNCILMNDVLCQCHTPTNLLNRLPQLLLRQGVVVISTSYDQNSQSTPKNNWLGGVKSIDQQSTTGFEAIKEIMEKNFDLLEETNIPVLTRKSDRVASLSIFHTHVWMKK